MFPWQVFGLTGSNLLAGLPRPYPVSIGVRPCLPLRGSSGLSPDSLFRLPHGRTDGTVPLYLEAAISAMPKYCGYFASR
jgi:hypothetical protein